MNSRRNWLKQTGIGIVGISVAPLQSFAIPLTDNSINSNTDKLPIRLRSNENPYGPSQMAVNSMIKKVNTSNRYDWESTGELISKIAKRNNIIPANILLGAGSTEILDLVGRFCSENKGSFILSDPTYNYWTDAVEKLGMKRITVPLTEDKHQDLSAMLKAIQEDTKLVYVCNPNNPTGTICDNDELISFINEATKKVIVLVDEAYIDYTNQKSLSELVKVNRNLIIAKTFSKIYGLAGARIGYGIAHQETIEKISQLQSWNNGSISSVSIAGAIASIEDDKFITETFTKNENVKKYTIENLERLNISCIASHTNFIYFSLVNYNKDFFEHLQINNILGTKIYEEKGKWSRITVGTMKEMQQFIKALE